MKNTEKYETVARNLSEKMSALNVSRMGYSGASLMHYDPSRVEESVATAKEMLEQKKIEIEQLEFAISAFEAHKELHAEWRDNEIAEYKALEERIKAKREAEKLEGAK